MVSILETVRKAGEVVRSMPMRARWHMLILVCTAVVFYAVIIYPASSNLSSLTRESAALKQQLDLQAKALPLYARWKAVNDISALNQLPQTPDGPMLKGDVQDIPARLTEAASKNGIVLASAIPQPNLKSGVANLVPVDIVAEGRFSDFRGFLLGISAVKGLHSVSHLKITRDMNREKLEARVWVVVE